MKLFFVVALALSTYCFSAIISAHSPSEAREVMISATQVKDVLRSRNLEDIIVALNEVKRDQRSAELLQLVSALWKDKVDGNEDLPWDLIRSPRVRIELANILAQADRNGYVKVDRGALRKYARSVLKGDDERAKGTAALTLGIINDGSDVAVLKKEALREQPLTFRSAVIALHEICDPHASLAISDLKRRVMREEYRAFLRQSTQDLVPYKRC